MSSKILDKLPKKKKPRDIDIDSDHPSSKKNAKEWKLLPAIAAARIITEVSDEKESVHSISYDCTSTCCNQIQRCS